MLLQLASKLQEHKDNIVKLKVSYISDDAKLKELNTQIIRLERTQKSIQGEFEPYLKDVNKLEIEATNILNIIQENNKHMSLQQIANELETRI